MKENFALKRGESGELHTPFEQAVAHYAAAEDVDYGTALAAVAKARPDLVEESELYKHMLARPATYRRHLTPAQAAQWDACARSPATAQRAHFNAQAAAQARGSGGLVGLADKIVAERFNGDAQRYSEALNLAGRQRPDLLAVYLSGDDVQPMRPLPANGPGEAPEMWGVTKRALEAIVSRLTVQQLRAVLLGMEAGTLQTELSAAGVDTSGVQAALDQWRAAKQKGSQAPTTYQTITTMQ